MLAAECLRLAAIEALRPTAAVLAGTGFPTLARHRVFDSRAAALEDLDRSKDYTPVLSLYTAESGAQLRGPLADATDTMADAALDIVAELAISDRDAAGEFADAMAGGDPEARMVLGALNSQIRYILEHGQAGSMFRHVCKRIIKLEVVTFAVPQLGLRFHRTTTRYHCEIRDDDFDVPAGQLPEPMRRLFNALPAQSYAKAKLAALAAHFNPDVLPLLAAVEVTTGPVTSGPDFTP